MDCMDKYNRNNKVITSHSLLIYSLWPLLKKDGLALQYFIFLPLWTFLSYESLPTNQLSRLIHLVPFPLLEYANEISMIALVAGHIVEAIWSPPQRWPDIFVLWNLTVCWGCFCMYWGWLVCGFWQDDFNLMMSRYGKKKKKVQ